PKVQHFGVIALGNKNICRLDVAMNDSFGVSGVERLRNLNRQGKKKIDIQWVIGDPMFESTSVQKLHRNEGLRFILADFVNRADVGMIQGRSGTRLAAEAFQGLRILGAAIR